MRLFLLAGALLFAAPALAASTAPPRDPRTVGLGRRCDKKAECQGKGQVCLHPTDARGKLQAHGFCALPCASLESGLKKPAGPKAAARERPGADAGTPRSSADAGAAAPSPGAADAGPAKTAAAPSRTKYKKVPPRCPARFNCRSAGSGVPIDLCVRD